MSGVYRCRLKRREMCPRSPVPSQQAVELTQIDESPAAITKEEPVKIVADAVPVETDVKAEAIKEPVKRSVDPAIVKRSIDDTAKPAIVKQKPTTPVVERSVEPMVVKEPIRHSAFHLFNNAPVQRTTKRAVNVNPLLRRRL